MRRYNYKAKDKKTGKEVKGSIQAENEQTAGHLLIDQGYIPEDGRPSPCISNAYYFII